MPLSYTRENYFLVGADTSVSFVRQLQSEQTVVKVVVLSFRIPWAPCRHFISLTSLMLGRRVLMMFSAVLITRCYCPNQTKWRNWQRDKLIDLETNEDREARVFRDGVLLCPLIFPISPVAVVNLDHNDSSSWQAIIKNTNTSWPKCASKGQPCLLMPFS